MPGSRKVEDIWGERGKRECRTTKERERERAVERPFYISSARLRRRQCRGFPQLHSAANFRSLHPPLFLLPTPTYTSYPTVRSTLINISSSSDLQPFQQGPLSRRCRSHTPLISKPNVTLPTCHHNQCLQLSTLTHHRNLPSSRKFGSFHFTATA